MRILFLMVAVVAVGQEPAGTPITTALGSVSLWDGVRGAIAGHDLRVRLGETPIMGEAILISATQVGSLIDGEALARYLSHMKAHAELGHGEQLERANQLRRVSPHIPPEYTRLDLQVMEAAANQRGDEIFRSTPCAQGACGEYDRALTDLRALPLRRAPQTGAASPPASAN